MVLSTLYNLAKEPANQKRIVEQNGLPFLIEFCSRSLNNVVCEVGSCGVESRYSHVTHQRVSVRTRVYYVSFLFWGVLCVSRCQPVYLAHWLLRMHLWPR